MDYIKTKLVRNGEVEKSAPPDELLKALEKVAADYGYILDDTELSDSPGWRKNPVATITVTGPVQCGKSIVILRLARILEEEFGAKVVLDDGLRAETNLVQDWVDVICALLVFLKRNSEQRSFLMMDCERKPILFGIG